MKGDTFLQGHNIQETCHMNETPIVESLFIREDKINLIFMTALQDTDKCMHD